ncbi:MAG: ABC transporter ATP-binding protein, partial [Propionibacteriaceae bacterium]|nr:ABC transporter ATP-binding protein [Propionibacteriaceae bacterium]
IRSGQIEVFGQPAGSLQLRHQVGYVTQAPSVYTDLTVRENVRYFASVAGAAAGEADRAVRDVGLTPQERQLVSTLSGGEWARASLACALVGRPRLLVLDEPTVGLDPVLREELWAMFRELAEAGTTLIVSSHVMDEAGRCDEILLLRGGSVIAQDTPKVLLAQASTDDLDRMFLTLIRAREAVA